MRIAILGTRGIPANYGGFETFAEELSTRLTELGDEVTVYCRQKHSSPQYRDVHLIYLPALKHKYAETLAHTLFSTLHLLFHRQEVVLYCNAANAIFTWMPRLLGMPVALNVDGIERKRKKWNAFARAWYLISERLATLLPSAVVTDAEQIRQYYQRQYRKQTTFIPYGAEPRRLDSMDILNQLELEPNRYFLYVSRFEPENNALLVREAFETIDTDHKLALIGDAPYAADYIYKVKDTNDARVLIPGAIYGSGYAELQSHAFAYIHATEVGGTHPALIEAMGRGNLILYLNTPENAEVAGGVGLPFESGNLADVLRDALSMSDTERSGLASKAQQRVRERYSWDTVTRQYRELFLQLQRS
jgi:glycosyltransferase involved in cell wall biosynthesis